MILIDMPMPKNCADCPCSYHIQTGDYAGFTMCEALEKKYPWNCPGYYLVEEYAPERPEKCLMKEMPIVIR